MKRIIYWTLSLMVVVCLTSCLKAGLDDLPVYDKADISNVKFEYRWWDEAAKQMRVVELSTEKEINGNTISCTLTVPDTNATFTEAIRGGVSLSNLVCTVDISSAARIQPVDGAPALGKPADLSAKAFTYLVVAADGVTSKEWTIKITDLKK